jgi:hypothetical protein
MLKFYFGNWVNWKLENPVSCTIHQIFQGNYSNIAPILSSFFSKSLHLFIIAWIYSLCGIIITQDLHQDFPGWMSDCILHERSRAAGVDATQGMRSEPTHDICLLHGSYSAISGGENGWISARLGNYLTTILSVPSICCNVVEILYDGFNLPLAVYSSGVSIW